MRLRLSSTKELNDEQWRKLSFYLAEKQKETEDHLKDGSLAVHANLHDWVYARDELTGEIIRDLEGYPIPIGVENSVARDNAKQPDRSEYRITSEGDQIGMVEPGSGDISRGEED